MAAAAISGNHPARSALDDELDALFRRGPALPQAARTAVVGVLESILAEGGLDERQLEAAAALRDALVAGPPQARAA